MNKALLLGLLLALPALAASDDARYCLVCHGSNASGNATVAAPNLSILPGWYLKGQLHGFGQGWRGQGDWHGQEMAAVAKAMSPQHIQEAIDFLAGLGVHRAEGTLDGDPARGQVLYPRCAGCHGDNGQGLEALQAPPLAGQSDWYLFKQLKAYRDGERGQAGTDQSGQIMGQVALLLGSDQEMRDLAVYLNQLSAPPH